MTDFDRHILHPNTIEDLIRSHAFVEDFNNGASSDEKQFMMLTSALINDICQRIISLEEKING